MGEKLNRSEEAKRIRDSFMENVPKAAEEPHRGIAQKENLEALNTWCSKVSAILEWWDKNSVIVRLPVSPNKSRSLIRIRKNELMAFTPDEKSFGFFILDLGRLLVAAWRLSGPECGFPLTSNWLAQELKQMYLAQQLPDWVGGNLHFFDSCLGPHCYEVLDAALWLVRADIITSSFDSDFEILISENLARNFLKTIKVEEEAAVSLGKRLRKAMAEHMANHDSIW